jgi:hypothetical protein
MGWLPVFDDKVIELEHTDIIAAHLVDSASRLEGACRLLVLQLEKHMGNASLAQVNTSLGYLSLHTSHLPLSCMLRRNVSS